MGMRVKICLDLNGWHFFRGWFFYLTSSWEFFVFKEGKLSKFWMFIFEFLIELFQSTYLLRFCLVLVQDFLNLICPFFQLLVVFLHCFLLFCFFCLFWLKILFLFYLWFCFVFWFFLLSLRVMARFFCSFFLDLLAT